MQQLGITLHEYHDSFQTFPPTSYCLTTNQSNTPFTGYRSGRGGRLLRLLPYMESSPVSYHVGQFDDMAGTLTTHEGGFNRITFDGLKSLKSGPLPKCLLCDNIQTSQGFKSNHQGGAHFVTCDAMVQFLTDDINYRVYQQLGDRRDGGPRGIKPAPIR